jgi:hypothetical protein
MEVKINTKIELFLSDFKKSVVDKILSTDDQTDTIQYIYNYPHFKLSPADIRKRGRVKNTVPFHNRCMALRANGIQCTRKKKNEFGYCGTHIKGQPHGRIDDTTEKLPKYKTVKVWVEEIGGIIRHLDDGGNIYDPQDIYMNTVDPKIIGKYTLTDGVYKLIS